MLTRPFAPGFHLSQKTDVADEGEIPLVGASQSELQKYAAEKETARIQNLEHLAQTNNIPELRKIAKQDAERFPERQLTAMQQHQQDELRYRYQQDTLAGYRTPLPASITKEQIYKWDANEMRRQMRRYGASRITARLQGVTEIPDDHGGTIRFE